jgi:serine/threonine-protein kinase
MDIESSLAEVSSAGPAFWRRPTGGKIRASTAILVSAPILVAAAAWFLLLHRAGEWKRGSSAVRSLVVLPSRDLSGSPGGQLMGDGLVDTLSARLGGLPGIQVVTPSVAVEAADRLADPFRAAKSVGANLAVRSSFMRSGDFVRIAYSVWDVSQRAQVASGTVDGSASDLFHVQDRLAESVAEGLKLKGGGKRPTVSVGLAGATAQERYLQALGNLQRYDKPVHLDTAIAALEELAAENPGSALVPAALGRAYLYKFNLTREKSWADKASVAVERARQLDPDLPEVNSTAGELAARTGKPKEAIAAFERTLAVHPNDFDALLGLGRAQDLMGEATPAEQTYRRAIALQPSSWIGYSKLGGFFYGQGRYAEAAEMFRRVITLAPDNARAFSNLGAAYYYMEDLDRALAAFERSIALEPSDLAYSNVGALRYYLGRYSEAAAAFEKALQMVPDHYLSWAGLGDAYSQLPGRQQEARAAYAKSTALARNELTTNPKDAQVHSYLALSLAKVGRWAEAEEHTAEALAAQPENPEYLFNAAVVANRATKEADAIEFLSKAIRAGFPRVVARREPEFKNLRHRADFEKAIETRKASA